MEVKIVPIAYHIDRSNTLYEGQSLELTPLTNLTEGEKQLKIIGLDQISHHAYNTVVAYHNTNFANTISFDQVNCAQMEKYLEIIRQLYFSSYPSRLMCLYSAKDIKSLKVWIEYLKLDEGYNVWEIGYDASKTVELDAYFLRANTLKNPFDFESLIKYWRGQISNNPLVELLIPLPVKVLRQVDVSHFI